jgi:WhiB family transcriptional regulator, redox-sensing transcriptional regulator
MSSGSVIMLARQAIELDKPVPCRDGDSRLWFAEDPEDLELAKAHCRSCPLRAPCLAGAIERREPCGVWGGEIFDRGKILPVKRRRGRPRVPLITVRSPYRITRLRLRTSRPQIVDSSPHR